MRTLTITVKVSEDVNNEALGQIAECFIAHTADEEKWLKEEGIIAEGTEINADANYRND